MLDLRRRLALPVLVATLGACDLTTPWASAPGEAVVRDVTYSPPSLAFEGRAGVASSPAYRTQAVSVGGLAQGVWVSPAPTSARGPIDHVAILGTSTISVSVKPADLLGPGTFEELVTLRACRSTAFTVGCESLGDAGTIAVRYVVAPPALTFSPPQLAFDQLVGGPTPAGQPIALDGPPGDGPWSASVDADWLDVSPLSGTSTPAAVDVALRGTPSWPATVTGSVRFERAGQSFSVPVRRSARAPLASIASDPLLFAIRQHEAPAAEPPQVAISTEQGAAVDLSVSASYGEPGVAPWLSFPGSVRTPGSFSLRLARTDVPVGRHTATLRVRDAWGSVDAQLPVVLDVAPPLLAISPPSLSFSVTATTSTQDATATLTLTSADSAIAWTASSDARWLAVAPTSGTTAAGVPTVLSASVVPDALVALPSGGSDAAIEIVGFDALGSTVYRIPVSLALNLPRVLAVGPGLDVRGAGGQVLVVGEGFTKGMELRFGQARVTADPAGYGTIRVTPPVLPPGLHEVTAPTAMGVTVGAAAYRVVEPYDAPAVAFDAPGAKTRIWFDDASGTLWAVSPGSGALERYAGASAWARAALVLPGLQDAGPAWDSTRVLTWSDAGARFVDAATLALAADQPEDRSGASWPAAHGRLAFFTEGTALYVGTPVVGCPTCQVPYYWLAPRAGAVLPGDWRVDPVRGVALGRTGERCVVAAARVTTVPGSITWWSAWERGTPFRGIARELPFAPSGTAVDRTGARSLTVRDGTSTPGDSVLWDEALGVLPGKLPATIAAAALAQDGLRAITFDGVSRSIRIFDLSVPPDPATGVFAEIGTGVAPAGDPGANVVLALSADDRILFVAGDERIAVVPLPLPLP